MGKNSLIKSTTQAPGKNNAGSEAKTISANIFKKFDTWKPETVFSVSPDKEYPRNYSAPPILSDFDEDEAGRIRELLLKNFDLKDSPSRKDTMAQTEDKANREKDEPNAASGPPTDKKVSDPVEKAMKYAGVCFVLLVALIIASSISNRNSYYLKTTDGAIEIWQGDFAPMGNELVCRLPEMQPPERIMDAYSKKEIFPLVFNYYIKEADALLDVPDMPDFERIKSYLKKAQEFGITEDLRKSVDTRLRHIDLMTLVYKADVAASKGTIADLEDAMGYLGKAASLDLDDNQARLIEQKTKSIRNLKKALEAKK